MVLEVVKAVEFEWISRRSFRWLAYFLFDFELPLPKNSVAKLTLLCLAVF